MPIVRSSSRAAILAAVVLVVVLAAIGALAFTVLEVGGGLALVDAALALDVFLDGVSILHTWRNAQGAYLSVRALALLAVIVVCSVSITVVLAAVGLVVVLALLALALSVLVPGTGLANWLALVTVVFLEWGVSGGRLTRGAGRGGTAAEIRGERITTPDYGTSGLKVRNGILT